jgi:hypothetical protein
MQTAHSNRVLPSANKASTMRAGREWDAKTKEERALRRRSSCGVLMVGAKYLRRVLQIDLRSPVEQS